MNLLIIRSEDLKGICEKILTAVDSNELSILTETLELKTSGKALFVSVTNREYFAQVKIDLGEDINFHATVNANLFLKLVSQITTDTIEMFVTDTSLNIKANGKYELPLIFEGEKLLELPEINIDNQTVTFDIDSEILLSILNYNSKELTKGTISKPVQKYYYVDESGAITFTSGACVNAFNLNGKVRMLLNNRLVKLFKLFRNSAVKFTMGYDPITDQIMQTKVRFETPEIVITAILSCDDTLINSVPVTAIRGRANALYNHSVSINREALLQTINRLLLFSSGLGSKEVIKPYSKLEFSTDSVTIMDVNGKNHEVIFYANDLPATMAEPYSACLDLTDLKTTLENCTEQFICVKFGDGKAFVLTRGNISNIIPEIGER